MAEDALKEIEDFAYRYLEKSEIALVTGVPLVKIDDESSLEGIAFLKGRLLRKAKFNESIIKLTDQLSSPAMAIELKIADAITINDRKIR